MDLFLRSKSAPEIMRNVLPRFGWTSPTSCTLQAPGSDSMQSNVLVEGPFLSNRKMVIRSISWEGVMIAREQVAQYLGGCAN
jgi:hypothetical protein